MANEKALEALSRIGETEDWRAAFIRQLIAFEGQIQAPGVDVREELTGPLVDALYDDDQVVRKTLSSGVTFEFLYRSKIARDFVMSQPEAPDHAWEPMTSRILVDLARMAGKGGASNVVIGGAYFGDHAVLIAREIGPQGKVHAFEPNNEQRGMLMRNAQLNGLTNILPRAEGLWHDSSTNLKLVGFDSFATAEAADADGDDTFKTVTIADYLRAQGVERLDLIVLDIEGAELGALKGAEPFLAKPAGQAPNILFEVHRHYVDWSNGLAETEIARFLTGHGYTLYGLRDFNSNYDLTRHPVELIPMEAIYLEGPPHGFNMVAVKDPALHHPVGGL